MRPRGKAAALVATGTLLLVGCGDDGGSDAVFGEPVEVDGLTVTLSAPARPDPRAPFLATEVTLVNDGDEAATFADPVLACDGESFAVDHNASNFPAEVSAGRDDGGTIEWTDEGACTGGGTIDVAGTTFAFEEPVIEG